MENKYVLESSYKINSENAKKFLDQNNLNAAKDALKKALQAAIGLMECSKDSDKMNYRAKAITLGQLLEKVNEKLSVTDSEKRNPSQTAKEQVKKDLKEEAPIVKVSVEEALKSLYELEGLQTVKAQVDDYLTDMKYNEIKRANGLPVTGKSNHMVFFGNPGTGKTTVARIMAQILHAMGIVSKGQLVEVSRSDLVAGYVGQTAIKTKEAVQKAIGGVLFIDEVYTLVQGGSDFGQEAIDTLLKEMEDNRDDLVIIVAGYSELMNKFIESNPGIASRLNHYIDFTDYNGAELFNIFNGMCKKNKYVLSMDAELKARNFFNRLYEERGTNFGNARDVRNIFEKTETRHGKRITANINRVTKEEIQTITAEDLSF